MEAKQTALSVDQAIELAFGFFDRYVQRGSQFSQVLLEELEKSADGGWIVGIGFSGGRFKETHGPFSSLGALEKEPLRDVRYFHIAADGTLEKMK